MNVTAAKKVLLVGWRVLTLRALKAAGAEVWCVTEPGPYSRFGAGVDVDRVLIVPDTTSIEAVAGAVARAGAVVSDFDHVISQQEASLAVAAAFGGVKSPISLQRVLTMRDKSLQKSVIKASGVAVADFLVMPSPEEEPCESLGFPVVIKPTLGAASANTVVVHNEDQFDAARVMMNASGAGPFMMEEFIDGQEYHVDGVLAEGEFLSFSIGRYLDNVITVRAGKLSGSVILSDSENPTLHGDIKAFCRTALHALGHKFGVFHMEIFVRGSDLIFSECAARVGGGPIEQLVLAHHGVNLHEVWIQRLLGAQQRAVNKPSADGLHGMAILMSPQAGTVISIPSESDFLEHESVVWARPMVSPGQVVIDPKAASDVHLAEVVVKGASESEVVRALHAVADWFTRTVRVQ